MATVTSKATGNWSAGSTWDSDPAIPGAGDDVVVAVGDAVTKDTAAAGGNDCSALAVDGTLIIGSGNGVRINGNLTGAASGKVQLDDDFEFFWAAQSAVDHSFEWDVDGSPGNIGLMDNESGGIVELHLDHADTHFRYVDIVQSSGAGTSPWRLEGHSFFNGNGEPHFYECWFDQTAFLVNTVGLMPRQGDTGITLEKCYFSGYTRPLSMGGGGISVNLIECDFGYQRDGTPDSVHVALYQSGSLGGRYHLYGCRFNVTSAVATNSAAGAWEIISENHDREEGEYYYFCSSGSAERSTAAKKAGDYGMILKTLANFTKHFPVTVTIAIPIETGDTVAPSFFIKNVNADHNPAGRDFYAVLDPGNAWGLFEEIDADDVGDPWGAWVELAFTGGVASGAADKGIVLVEFSLRKFVSGAQYYLADPDDGVS